MPVDNEQFLRTLGQVIRQARKSKKMTQEDLSELAGVNAKYLGEMELGKTNPTVVFLLKVSWALGMKMVDLFFAIDPSQGEESVVRAEIGALVRILSLSDLRKLRTIINLITDKGTTT